MTDPKQIDEALEALDEMWSALPGAYHKQFGIVRAALERQRLPKEPPSSLLVSMAMRLNHGFGLDDFQAQQSQINEMRQIYEEVSGHGFYDWDGSRDGYYLSLLAAAPETTKTRRQ